MLVDRVAMIEVAHDQALDLLPHWNDDLQQARSHASRAAPAPHAAAAATPSSAGHSGANWRSIPRDTACDRGRAVRPRGKAGCRAARQIRTGEAPAPDRSRSAAASGRRRRSRETVKSAFDSRDRHSRNCRVSPPSDSCSLSFHLLLGAAMRSRAHAGNIRASMRRDRPRVSSCRSKVRTFESRPAL